MYAKFFICRTPVQDPGFTDVTLIHFRDLNERRCPPARLASTGPTPSGGSLR
jgi:hypothetical protein